jgi:hypothetical protein
MLKKLFAALSIGLGLLSAPAEAQVVQPVYTRPAKGKALSLFNQPVNTDITPVSSSIYDWTGFAGMAFTLNRADASRYCQKGVQIQVYGGPTTNLNDFELLGTTNGYYNAQVDGAWYVSVPTPYAYVKFYSYGTGDGASCPGNVTVTMTPVPFDPSSRGVSNAFAALSILGSIPDAFYAFQADGNTPRSRFQNVGTTVVKCSVQPVDGTFIPPYWPIYLKAGSANDDGTGGTVEFDNLVARVLCTNAVAGQSMRLAYMAY